VHEDDLGHPDPMTVTRDEFLVQWHDLLEEIGQTVFTPIHRYHDGYVVCRSLAVDVTHLPDYSADGLRDEDA
jgi:hypothetical protein